jgi:hypothetical protein
MAEIAESLRGAADEEPPDRMGFENGPAAPPRFLDLLLRGLGRSVHSEAGVGPEEGQGEAGADGPVPEDPEDIQGQGGQGQPLSTELPAGKATSPSVSGDCRSSCPDHW